MEKVLNSFVSVPMVTNGYLFSVLNFLNSSNFNSIFSFYRNPVKCMSLPLSGEEVQAASCDLAPGYVKK